MEQEGEHSFDPRAWVTEQKEVVHKASSPSASEVNNAHPKSRFFISLGLSTMLIGLGFVSAWFTRETAHIPIPAKSVIRSQPLPVAPGVTQHILNLANSASLRDALIANGISADQADAASRSVLAAIGNKGGEVRAVISVEQHGAQAKLIRLEASFADSSGAVASALPDGTFTANAIAASLNSQIVVARGEMNDTDFYSSAVAAGVTDSLITPFAQAFVYDFNFQTEIKAGDIFEAAFEQKVNANGQPVGPPRLLYGSMTTSDKARAVYRFQPSGENEGWFDGNGRSVRRSFMRTPVDGARITSSFGMRFHPVLHYTRLHGGTDFAAPVGTPIYATAGGTIEVANPSSCAGNMVIMKHDNGWETAYFHMAHYAPDIHVGERVEQGHQLGVVGVTGICTTGPHLHYEVHINGGKVDPEQIPTEQGETLKGDILKAFLKERDRIDLARARYAG